MAGLDRVTEAPTTTAPDGSVTTPVTPDVAWAAAGGGVRATTASRMASDRARNFENEATEDIADWVALPCIYTPRSSRLSCIRPMPNTTRRHPEPSFEMSRTTEHFVRLFLELARRSVMHTKQGACLGNTAAIGTSVPNDCSLYLLFLVGE